MFRVIDFTLATVGLLVLWPLLAILYVLGQFDTGAPLFRQTRVGRDGKPFVLIKFRTMKIDTPSVATHAVNASAVTRLGHFLRRSKLDELPQLVNVVRGEMSLVGPRPSLPSQHELIAERSARGVLKARPGITGLAQASGIDMSQPVLLAETDAEMLGSLSIANYFRYILLTLMGRGKGDRINSASGN